MYCAFTNRAKIIIETTFLVVLMTAWAVCFVSPSRAKAESDPSLSQLDVASPSQKKKRSAAAFRVLFIGDSITRHGFNPTTIEKLGWDHIAGMAATAEQTDYVHQFIDLLQERLPERAVEIHIHSSGGSGSAARRLAAIEDVRGVEPHLVVVQLGEHEKAADGEEALRSSYAKLISAFDVQTPKKPQILCTGVWKPGDGTQKKYRGWVATVERVMREACRKKGIPFASVEKYALDPTCSGWGKSMGVKWHPNDKGHAGYARALLEAYDTLPVADADHVDARKHFSSDLLYHDFRNPPSQARPSVRWWWNGNRITQEEISRELDILQEAGIGGVEINPVGLHAAKISKSPSKSLTWLGPEWNAMLKYTTQETKKRGMIADLIAGTGWPFGGEFLEPGQMNQALEMESHEYEGPREVTFSWDDLLGKATQAWKGKGPKIAGHGDPPRLKFLRLIPRDATGVDDFLDLLGNVQEDGSVRIEIPEGKHRLYVGIWKEGYISVAHGAAGGAGPVMDHFDQEVVEMYLNRMSDTLGPVLGGNLGEALRSMFCDSIELAAANWTDDMPEQFEMRRGYRLDPYLPLVILPERDLPEKNRHPALKETIRRVRYDFSRTIVEVFLERFVQTFANWCRENGTLSRYQSYGMPQLVGLAEGALIPDIPESNNWMVSPRPYDQGSWVWHKYASSAGHLKGRKFVSNEAMTNVLGVFQTTLHQIKQADDMNFIMGMNSTVLHGFNYSPPEAGFPGWVRYGTYFSEQNTWWPYFRKWADYNGRLSAVFQKVQPVGQCAILAPTADIWSDVGLHRGSFHKKPWYCHCLWEPLQQSGYAADYLSETVLQGCQAKNGKLLYGPMAYEVLVLAGVETILPETLRAIHHYMEEGGKLIILGAKPDRSPSLKNAAEQDQQVQSLMKSIDKNFSASITYAPAPKEPIPRVEKTHMEDLLVWTHQLLREARIRPQVEIVKPNANVYQVHYQYHDRPVFFFVNQDEENRVTIQAKFPFQNKTPWRWDAETGQQSLFDWKDNLIVLDPLESLLLVFESKSQGETNPRLARNDGVFHETNATWDLTLQPVQGQPAISRKLDRLIDLGMSDDPQFNTFAGVAIYRTKFHVTDPHHSLLDLGKVHGVSEVKLNGKPLGVRWWGKRRYDAEGVLVNGENELEIRVTTVLSNYIHTLKENPTAVKWAKFHIDRNAAQVSTGLVGPVRFYGKEPTPAFPSR